MASSGNQHCDNFIGTLSFPISYTMERLMLKQAGNQNIDSLLRWATFDSFSKIHHFLCSLFPPSVPSTHHSHHPSPRHSFIPGLKPSFSANLPRCSLSFLLQDWLHGFPGLFTDTSGHCQQGRYYFILYSIRFSIDSGVTMGWLLRLVTGDPTGGRGPPIVLAFLVINCSVCLVLLSNCWRGRGGWLRYASVDGVHEPQKT